MAKKVSAAQAKAHLSALMAEVAYGNKRILIERRRKPVAALVSIADLERLEQGQMTSQRPLGALALVGVWREARDEDIEALIGDVYRRRKEDRGRPVELEA